MTKSITRRAMLALAPAALAGQGLRNRTKQKPLPAVGEFVRFIDPTTETPVVRLTALSSASFLPPASNHFVSVKDRYLLLSSDRNKGRLAPFQLDLHSGAIRQLADGKALVSDSLCLDSKERHAYWLDEGSLRRIEMGKKQQASEEVAEGVSGFSLSPSSETLFVTRRGKVERLDDSRVLSLPVTEAASDCQAHPAGQGCLYVHGLSELERQFWYTAVGQDRPVLLAQGAVSNPIWSPDGQTLLFLREVAGENVMLSEIHEVGLDGKGERCVAPTSQFASFAPNFDGSVFVGASRSKAQPNIVLLLRSVKREMTLCQHRASKPARVRPAFSPDARRVYFQSDEEGKPALYSVNVERLVEPPEVGQPELTPFRD